MLSVAENLKPEMFATKMTAEEYQSAPGMRKTLLDLVNRSPAHMKNYLQNPPEPTGPLIFGQNFHDAALLPELLPNKYAVAPKCDKRTKDGKALWEKFQSENIGKILISEEEHDQTILMLNSLYTHPEASKLLSDGHPELSYFWKDRDTGIDCKCRPDFLRSGHILIDLKTADDASFKSFQRSVAKWRYHVQAAFYMDGVSSATGKLFDKFVLIVIEKKAPFAVAIYALDDATVEAGRMEYKKNLITYAECLKEDRWPGYPQEIQDMNLPAWAWSSYE